MHLPFGLPWRMRWQTRVEERILMTSELKVALVASSLGRAGAEKQFCYIAQALRVTGVDARVFHIGRGGHYANVLQQSNVPYYAVKSPGKRLLILAELTRQFLSFRPHIVIASQFGDVTYAGLAGRATGSFVIAGIRSSGNRDVQMYGWRSRWMLGLANGLMTNSTCARKNLLALGVPDEKIAILPNVIDLHDFDSRTNCECNNPFPGRVLAVAVGRMHPNKRFDWFLEALSLARRKAPQLAGLIVGGDEGDHERLQARARDLGLSQNDFRFYGESSNVGALLRQTGMLVLTSEYEGFPNAILEAMSARLPVITTHAGEAPLLVKHGMTGYVADNVSDISDHMGQLANSLELRHTMGTAGRAKVESHYDYESLPARLLTVFHLFATLPAARILPDIFRKQSIVQRASIFELMGWATRS
jgi:glycosyltransferase involved in cell wall biosynthesis